MNFTLENIRGAVREIVPTLHGWATIEKADALVSLVLDHKPTICVEIGVFGGRSLIPIAAALSVNQKGFVVGIDPWRKEPALEGNLSDADKGWWGKVDLHEIHRACMESIWGLGLGSFARILRTTSEDALPCVPFPIDLCHIDGNHSEEVSMRDVNNYVPLVREGGHVVFDDIDWTTTKAAQVKLAESCDLLYTVGTCGFYRKR